MRNVLLSALALLCLFVTLAQGQRPETGAHMLCDTQAQIERVVRIFYEHDVSPQEAAAKINAEKAHSCEVFTVAIERVQEVNTFKVANGTMHIIEVLVLGVLAPSGQWIPVNPETQYIALLEKEEAV